MIQLGKLNYYFAIGGLLAMIKPNYDNSIMSVSNSLLKHFGVEPHHATLHVFDDLLLKEHKNVVLLIMDGMGINVLERHLPQNAFLREHIISEISSVYPCTTTAALTSILTGKTPNEHGWIGWSNYFKEVDKCIDLFSNHESGTENNASSEHLPNKILAYESIFSQIGSNVKTCAVSPFAEYFANTMEGICEHIKSLCSEDSKKFIYAYHYQPDHDMHDYGVSHDFIKRMMINYNNQLETLIGSLSDTLFLITADHGMADITMKSVEDYPTINNALIRHICVEPRCCSMYVKDEYKADFEKVFVDIFNDKFKLFTHDEFINSGLLGDGIPHAKVSDFVGDFIAIAVSDVALWYKDINGEYNDFKGAHAGLTRDEMRVPLIVIEKE